MEWGRSERFLGLSNWHAGGTLQNFCKNLKFHPQKKLWSIMVEPKVLNLNDWNKGHPSRMLEENWMCDLRYDTFDRIFPGSSQNSTARKKDSGRKTDTPLSLLWRNWHRHPKLSKKKSVKNDYVRVILKGQRNQKAHGIKKLNEMYYSQLRKLQKSILN